MFNALVFPIRSKLFKIKLEAGNANSSEMCSVWGRRHGGYRWGEEGQSQFPNTLELEDAPSVMETLLSLYRQDSRARTHTRVLSHSVLGTAPGLQAQTAEDRQGHKPDQLDKREENKVLWGT